MTRKGLQDRLRVAPETADRILGLIRGTVDYRDHPAVVDWARQCYHDPRDSSQARSECVMRAINAELGGYGVEAIEGRYVDHYNQHIQAIYVNLGDTYTPTILYDTERQVYRITSWGNWVETYERRRQLQ